MLNDIDPILLFHSPSDHADARERNKVMFKEVRTRDPCRVSRTKPVRLRFKKEKKVEDTLARVEPKDNDVNAFQSSYQNGLTLFFYNCFSFFFSFF